MPALRSRAAAVFSAVLFLAPAASTLFATDPNLDSAFVTTISPGITPDSYVPLSVTNPVPPDWSSGTGAVNAVALQSDGKIVIGGNISRYKAPPAGSAQTSLKRLNADGTLDTAFGVRASTLADSQGQTEVNKILTVAGDKLYVGGVFTSYDGVTQGGIIRLNADGSLDADPVTGFNAAGVSNFSAFGVRYVLAIAEQPDGKVLVGGGFNRANGSYRPNLARFHANGALDTSFDPSALLADSTFIGDIAVLPDGDIIVAGGRGYAGGSKPLLMRLNSDGSLDPSLAPAFADDYGDIDELLVLPDGRILVGGDLTLLPSGTHYYFACFRPDGSLDTTFMTNVGAGPNGWAGGELALQPDGTIFVGGIFSSWAGQPRASVARLQPDGALDLGFAPPPHTLHPSIPAYTTHFYSFAFQPDGKLVAGGWFARVSDNAVESYNLTRFVNEYAPASPGTLRLVATSVSTAENAGFVTLEVSRFGGVTGAVTVNYATLTGASDGTATAGVDFTSASGTLSWAAGEGGVKTITVPILADAAADGDKTFTVRLTNNTPGTFLPTPAASARVAIRDVQAAPAITAQPASVSIEQGARFSLSIRYDSVLAATIQWQRDPDGPGGLDYADIPGATSPAYTVANADAATHAGLYRARVTNANGSTPSSSATVSISVPAGSVITGFAPADPGSIGLARRDSADRHLVSTNTGVRRLGADGVLEPTTSFGIQVSGVQALLAADDGRTYIAGNLSIPYTHQPSGATSSVSTRLFRLNADATGTIDTAFSVFVPGPVTALAQISGNRIVAGCSAAATNDTGLRVFSTSGTVSASFPTGFATGTGASVHVIREQTDGKILVAYTNGNSGFGGNLTYNIARFTSAFALDTTFGTGGIVTLPTSLSALDVLPDGRIAIAARLSNLLNGNTQFFAILKSDGTFDDSFASPLGVFNGYPTSIAYRDGRLLVSGTWTTVNGASLGGLARLNLDGSLDNTFSIGAGSVGTINAAYYTATGEIFIGGSFTSFKGVSRNRAALLVGNPHIGAIGFAPPRLSVVESNQTLALTLRRYGPATEAASISWATADGTALAGADYTASSGTVSWAAGDSADKTVSIPLIDDTVIESAKTFTVALSGATGPVGPAAPATITVIDSDTPVTISAQPNGSALLSGGSLSLSATATSPSPITYQWFRNGSAISGATSASYAKTGVTAADAGVYTLVATNASGAYTTTPVFVAVRPQPGSIHTSGPGTNASFVLGGQIKAIVPLANGGAYVGGWFSSVSTNTSYRYFVRVNADLTLDATYNPAPSNNVHAVIRQPDGKILVGGDFTTWAGQSISRLVRLNADGSLDTAFNAAMGAGPTAAVNALALLADGRIVVGGSFTGFQGDNYLTVLLATGAPDTAFASTASNGAITKLAVCDIGGQPRILAGGTFTNFSGANRLALLNIDGTRDTTFTNAVTGANGTVNDILILADGRILVAGSFGATQVGPTGASASNLGSSLQVFDLAQAPGGSILVVRTGSVSTEYVFRFKGTNPFPTPGSSDNDPVFTAGIGTGPATAPSAVAVGPDGVVWLGGQFSSFNSAAVGGLVKLYGDPANPAVVNPPAHTGVIAGRTATFGVGAFGTGLTYQWFKNGAPLFDGGDISGATTPLLSIANTELSDQADYRVEVTGGSPSTTVTSTVARLYVLGAPVVATPPAAVDIIAGPALTISAEVFAAAPATYQWSKDGVPLANDARITGAATATLAFASTLASDTGSYTLTITNAQGSATTSVFALVRPVPASRAPAYAGISSSQSVTAFQALPDGGMLVANLGGTLTNNSVTTLTNRLQLVRSDGTVANLGLDPANPSLALPSLGAVTIRTLFRQPDGKILVGGDYASILRLLPDGTLDPAFPPIAGSTSSGAIIRALALDDAGRILAGGDFTNFNGVTGQNHLVRLDATTGALDTTFVSGFFSGSLTSILKLPGANSGFIIGGVNLANPYTVSIRRYDAAGANVASFNGLSYLVNTLALAPDGASFYAAIQSAPYLVRYRVSDGSLDPAFSVPSGAFNNQIHSLAVQPDGKVLAHGQFNIYPMTQVGRVLPTGAIDPTFVTGGTNTNNTYFPLALDAAGRVWVGGSFTAFNNTTPVNRVAVLEGDVPSLAWAVQPLPRSVVAGDTIAFSAAARASTPVAYQWFKNGVQLSDGGRISGANTASLSITGATVADEGAYTVRATSQTAGMIESAPAELVFLAAPEILAMPAGRTAPAGAAFAAPATARGAGTLSYQWLHGGEPVSGQTSAALAFPAPATTDTGWYQLRVTNSLGAVTSAPVLFTFAQYAGYPAGGLAAPVPNNPVTSLHPLAGGGMALTGSFTSLDYASGASSAVNGFDRLTSSGAPVAPAPMLYYNYPSFGAFFAGSAAASVRDSQGRLVIAGGFDGVVIDGVGVNRRSVARFNADGTLDTTWNTATGNFIGNITCIAVDASDNIYVGGGFTNFAGVSGANRLVRLSASTGAVDTTFLAGTTLTSGTINAILPRPDGRVLAAGTVSGYLFESNATLAPGFTYAGGNSVVALAAHPAGGYLVGRTSGSYLARISDTGALVTPFPATGSGPAQAVRAILPLSGDRFIVAGNFTTYNSVTTGRIAIINADGTANSSMNFGAGFTDGQVNALALDTQDRLWAGGTFTLFRGASTPRLAVISTTDFTPATPPSPSTPFETYLTGAGVPVGQSGPTDDPDGDGIGNLLEYALGLAPMTSDPDGLPVMERNGGFLTYTYFALRPELLYEVETTATLGSLGTWTTAGIDQGVPAGDGLVTATVPYSAGSRFLRLRVTVRP